MKKFLVLTAMCGLVLPFKAVKAQTICGNEIVQQQIESDPVAKAAYDKYWANYVKENKEMSRAARKTTYTHANIPVVFHVILNQTQIDDLGGVSGIHERIASQLIVLNEDFNAKNSDINNVPEVFKPVVGNPQMTFAVAKKNPNGQLTYAVNILTKPANFTGYPPHSYDVKRSVMGGADPWDNTKYLNVWVTNITNPGSTGQVLGWGYNPTYAGNTTGDPQLGGVVIHYLTLGKKTQTGQKFYSSNTQKGRTLTHELGHFFDIWHVWGNTPVGSGTCGDDDGIDDTPRQEDATQSCPLPLNKVIPNCTIESHPGGEMYMNFMDYSGDNCTRMFTELQVARMRKTIDPGGSLHGLTTDISLVYWPNDISIVEYNNNVRIAPNPSNGIFTINMVSKNNNLDKITVSNIIGQTVKNIDIKDQNLTEYTIDITGMTKGVYMVQMHFDAGVISRKVVLK